MSTRGLIGFVRNGQVRASFNHFDSYLVGLGQSIVDLCTIIFDWETFTSRYEKINWITERTESMKYISGKEIMMEILKDNPLTLLDEKDFENDTLFCEYAYLINLDTKELEIYSQNYQTNYDQSDANLSLNLLVKYPLDEIPSNWIDFLTMRMVTVDINKRDKQSDHRDDLGELEL